MKKLILLLLAVIFVVIALGFWVIWENPEKLANRVILKQINTINEQAEKYVTEQGMIVYTIGTSTPLPGKRAQTCTAIFIDGKFFLFDIGYSSVAKLEQFGFPLDKIEALFITHWHSDHFMDLPYLINRSWQRGRQQALHVYAPEGVDSILNGIREMLHIERQHRLNHHGAKIMNPELAGTVAHSISVPKRGSQLAYSKDGIVITAFDVCHEPVSPDFGYTIEYKGKKIVLSGDTKKCEQVFKYAQGADMLIHEAMLLDMMQRASDIQSELGDHRNATILEDVIDYHTSPRQAAEIAEAAGVKKLVLNHLGPTPDNIVISRLYRKDIGNAFKGPIFLANDGDKFIVE